jgi:hypothetical protein
MTFDTFVGLVVEHWVLISLVLCPIVVVMMALAALACEACGAPFGIFRRRNRTIDLCLRCALLHDYRKASETRQSSADNSDSGSPSSTSESDAGAQSQSQSRAEDRRYATRSPVPLGVAPHPEAR